MCDMSKQGACERDHLVAARTQGRRVRRDGKSHSNSVAWKAGAHQRGSPELAALGPGEQDRMLSGHAVRVHVRLQPQAPRLLVRLRATPKGICLGLGFFCATRVPGSIPRHRACWSAGAQHHAKAVQRGLVCLPCNIPCQSQLRVSAAARLERSSVERGAQVLTHDVRAASRVRTAAARAQGDSMCGASVGVWRASQLPCAGHSLCMGSAGCGDPAWGCWGRLRQLGVCGKSRSR